jgi:hypothetical protein
LGDVRAELQVPAVDLLDQRLAPAAVGVHREQAAWTVAHQQAPVAGDGETQRTAPGVTDDGCPTVGRDAHDAPVVDAGPDVPVGVDHHVLRRIARNGDDGQFG